MMQYRNNAETTMGQTHYTSFRFQSTFKILHSLPLFSAEHLSLAAFCPPLQKYCSCLTNMVVVIEALPPGVRRPRWPAFVAAVTGAAGAGASTATESEGSWFDDSAFPVEGAAPAPRPAGGGSYSDRPSLDRPSLAGRWGLGGTRRASGSWWRS